MPWTPEDRSRLLEALLSAYTVTSLETMLKLTSDKNLADCSPRDLPRKDTFLRVIATAEAGGWIDRLVRCAYREQPENPVMDSFFRDYERRGERPGTDRRELVQYAGAGADGRADGLEAGATGRDETRTVGGFAGSVTRAIRGMHAWKLGLAAAVMVAVASVIWHQTRFTLPGTYRCTSESLIFSNCVIQASGSGQLQLSFQDPNDGIDGLLDRYHGSVTGKRCGLSSIIINDFSPGASQHRTSTESQLALRCDGRQALSGTWSFADGRRYSFRMDKMEGK